MPGGDSAWLAQIQSVMEQKDIIPAIIVGLFLLLLFAAFVSGIANGGANLP